VVGAKTNFVIRLFAGWSIAIMMFGPVVAERPVELKHDVISSSAIPVVGFSDTSTQQIANRAPSVKLQSLTLAAWSVLGFGTPSQFSRGDIGSLRRVVPRGTSLFLLRTLLLL
jgi:hypothetical protein